jgi:hypothetical protein
LETEKLKYLGNLCAVLEVAVELTHIAVFHEAHRIGFSLNRYNIFNKNKRCSKKGLTSNGSKPNVKNAESKSRA